MGNNKRNTISGQIEQYGTPVVDWLSNIIQSTAVPQPGEPGYVPVTTSQQDIEAIEKAKSQYQNVVPSMDMGTQEKLFANIPSGVAEKAPSDSEMNPVVKEYLSKKMNLAKTNPVMSAPPDVNSNPEMPPLVKKPDYMDKFNDEAYNKVKADSESRQSNLSLAELASGIGDSLARRDSSGTDNYFKNLKANIKDETVGQFQRDKSQAVDDFKNKEMMDQYNPESSKSVAFRKMIEAQFPNVSISYGKSWNQVTAADKENIFDPLKLKENIEARKDSMRIAAMGRQDNLDFKKAELARKNSPEERRIHMSSSDKSRYDNALMTLKGIDDMATALDNGQNTFSVIGDNDYTAASRRATEAYGRMQSGGAINKDEEKRFEATLPRSADNKEMQRNKLLKQRDEMLSRLKTLGFSQQDADYEPRSFNYGSKESSNQDVDSKIKSFMQKNGISDRNEAIKILKDHGKI